jgi:general secretion pathway protein G
VEEIGRNSQETNNQSTKPAGIIKTSAAASWSLICAIAGFLVPLLLIFFGILEFVLLGSRLVLGAGFVLCAIGLALGIFGLIQIHKYSGRLRGSGHAINGLIISAIVIIGWTALMIPFLRFPSEIDSASDFVKESGAMFEITRIEDMLKVYLIDKGSYPAGEYELKALANDKVGSHNLIELCDDPWKRPIHFRYPGIRNPKSFDIWSAGKDGIEGTADDITNFK